MSQERTYVDIDDQTRERAILVGIELRGQSVPIASSLAELERLVDTAGAEVVASTYQRLESINPKTFIGSGKAAEVARLCVSLDAQLVVFDDELSPSQQNNLERIVGKQVKVIDRTALILDIFALHATTKEGRLQVKLAQNQYLYPRLRGMWAHLASNRMGGGVGSRFGEGESQLEVDRRMVRKRITSIKAELAAVSAMRTTQRSARMESGVFKIALAGYTNAGKSSLMNALTQSDVLAYDKLFATLDSTTRKLRLRSGRMVTLTDTVGFIQKLPTTLIEAFNSTLVEICDADIILHVIDASSHELDMHIQAVEETLAAIGAEKVPRIIVFNKSDCVDEAIKDVFMKRYIGSSIVSAHTGEGLDDLMLAIERAIAAQENVLELLIPYNRGDIVSRLHAMGSIMHESYKDEGTYMQVRLAPALMQMVQDFVI